MSRLQPSTQILACMMCAMAFCLPQRILACTTAVISGRATNDGRPILWKNRDTSNTHNEVAVFNDGKHRVVAVVNAGKRSSVWMGVNAVGFCIENSLSKDLRIKQKTKGPGNGAFMKRALQTCKTVEDFRQLLEETNGHRTTVANFGVIDAHGGAAMFEAGPRSFTMFDANDPDVAPNGYIVRTNFATTAHGFEAAPDPASLGDIYSSKRFLQTCRRLAPMHDDGIDVRYMLRNVTRDMSDESGVPFPGSVNAFQQSLPAVIPTSRTISRSTTVSAAIMHGVKPGEKPEFATMWTLLGDPKFSIAVPCWAGIEEVADPLVDPKGAELGEVAIALRKQSLTETSSVIETAGLPGIWNDVWPVEDDIIEQTQESLHRWREHGASPAELTSLHHRTAAQAMRAMTKELQELN